MKVCIKCRVQKDEARFSVYQNSNRPPRLRGVCKDCTNKRNYAYRKANPEQYKNSYRKYREKHPGYQLAWQRNNPDRCKGYQLKYYYGLSLEEKIKLNKQQNGRCAICKVEVNFDPINVDHDPETLIVRGLLCPPCNRAIGILKHDLTRFESAINYLAPFVKIKENAA